MQHRNALIFCFLLCWTQLQVSSGYLAESKVLNIGEELQKETLPLQAGSRIYRLHGLKPSVCYEVKISYPASIPASFSIQLNKGDPDLLLKRQRKLLNTEKLIFKNDNGSFNNEQSGMYILVSVVPAGVVAIPYEQEREYVIFNIVCDELLLGIPYNAWWVAFLVILCLGFAFVIPSLLPPYLLHKECIPESTIHVAEKDS